MDNKGMLFVTLFEIRSYPHDRFVMLYTATAPMAIFKLSASRLVICSPAALYRDTRIAHKICTRTAKSAPWFVHSGCVSGLYPDSKFLLIASNLKPTQTHFIAWPLGISGEQLQNQLMNYTAQKNNTN